MFAVEIRPSLRILQQVATIERFCGGWERVATQAQFADASSVERALLQGVIATAELDQSTPPAVLLQLRHWHDKNGRDQNGAPSDGHELLRGPLTALGSAESELRALFQCHQTELPFSPAMVELCHRALTGESIELDGLFADHAPTLELGDLDTSRFRKTTGLFLGPRNEVVFQTIPAFLIEQRLEELLEWTSLELDGGRYHPLLVGGVFYLLFLQTSPYERANHRLAIVLLWQFLQNYGYGFVRHNHFARQFHEHSNQYLIALRQAEKTAHGNWSSLNSWLEFFLQSLCVGCAELERVSERGFRQSRLSSVQRDIIDVIRSYGSATREKIVRDTGINLSTVKYNLTVLSSRGHLRREGGGRTTSYTIL